MKKYNVIIPYRHKGQSRVKLTFNTALEVTADDDESAERLAIEEFEKLTALSQVKWEKEIIRKYVQVRLVRETEGETLEFATNFKDKFTVVLDVIGSIDGENVDRFQRQLAILKTKNFNNVILDFKQLDYINSSGIGVLVENLSVFKIAILNVGAKVRDVLDLVGLTKILSIFDTAEEARDFLINANQDTP